MNLVVVSAQKYLGRMSEQLIRQYDIVNAGSIRRTVDMVLMMDQLKHHSLFFRWSVLVLVLATLIPTVALCSLQSKAWIGAWILLLFPLSLLYLCIDKRYKKEKREYHRHLKVVTKFVESVHVLGIDEQQISAESIARRCAIVREHHRKWVERLLLPRDKRPSQVNGYRLSGIEFPHFDKASKRFGLNPQTGRFETPRSG